MKSRTLAIVGIVLFLVFLVALLPARVAIGWVAPPGITLAGVSGTVWSGSAAQLGVNGRLVGRLQWRDGSILAFIGRPAWDIELERSDGFLRGRIGLAPGGRMKASALEGATSLPALRGLVPVGQVDGNVSLRLDEFALDGGQLERIDGRVVIDAVRPPGLRDGTLGTIAVRFPAAEDTPLTGTIEVDGGPIRVVDARIQLQPDGSYEVGGRIAATPDAPREVNEALRYMGSPDADGYRPFSFAGTP